MTSEAARLIAERGITLISFDLDDTLVDSDGAAPVRLDAAARRASEVIPGLAADLLVEARSRALAADPVVQGRLQVFFGTLGVEFDSEPARAIRAAYNELLPAVLQWTEGAPELLVRLRGRYRLAIVTNGPTTIQRPKVDKFRLSELVDHIVVSGEVGVDKPDPAIFQHLLREAGTVAERAVHIGDSLQSDIAGANAAGMGAIWFPPQHRTPERLVEGGPRPDAILRALSELADL